jgi:hypothetical protein
MCYCKPQKFFTVGLAVLIWISGLTSAGQGSLAARPAVTAACPPLAAAIGQVLHVDSVDELQQAVNQAIPGTTILVTDGTYNLDGVYLRFDTPDVTLRSASGNREAVILDGNYITTEIIQIVASGVTIADLTLREALYHPVHVMSTTQSNTHDTLLYNIHILDPGQQAIKINPVDSTHFADDGEIACSTIEMTTAGRLHVQDNCYTGGIDAHAARNWLVRDNSIQGFWCAQGLSEHAVHFWKNSRDTRVERNILLDNARGVGFGLQEGEAARTYADDPCPQAGGSPVDHFGGLIVNNFIAAAQPGLLASEAGFDCGICLWYACSVSVLHNSVYAVETRSASIEWRFAVTSASILNNLASHDLLERDGASAVLAGNLSGAPAGWFADPASGDLHLTNTGQAAIDQAAPLPAVRDDIDLQPRPQGLSSDIGADETGGGNDASHHIYLPRLGNTP